MAERPRISVIGPGRVGRAIARTARRVGYTIAAVAGGSSPAAAEEFANELDAKFCSSAEAALAADLLLLTVKDGAIGPVCQQLATANGLARKPIVVHCSGALDTSVLEPAVKAGCAVGSMHPLQTFPSAQAAIGRLPGTYWFLEGDPDAVETMTALASAMAGRAVPLKPEDKPLYHAAAVLSANYLTTLIDAAVRLFERFGVDEESARKAIAPLSKATVDNALSKGTAEALTGPIARGDHATVAKHLAALVKLEDGTDELYRAVGMRTIDLAFRSGNIDAASAEQFAEILRPKDEA